MADRLIFLPPTPVRPSLSQTYDSNKSALRKLLLLRINSYIFPPSLSSAQWIPDFMTASINCSKHCKAESLKLVSKETVVTSRVVTKFSPLWDRENRLYLCDTRSILWQRTRTFPPWPSGSVVLYITRKASSPCPAIAPPPTIIPLGR